MKNKGNVVKQYRLCIAIGLFLGIGFILFFRTPAKTHSDLPHVCSKKVCFEVEVVGTKKERQQGLMYRESMPELSGMLFVFEKSDIYNFWMKNTLIPLDMIWMDEDLNVVRVLTAQPCEDEPCTIYMPETEALYTLEINAGLAAKYRIVEWMKMRLIDIQ